jgi:hypothetical protein
MSVGYIRGCDIAYKHAKKENACPAKWGERKARNVVSSKCEHPHKNVETDSRTRSSNDIQSGKPSPSLVLQFCLFCTQPRSYQSNRATPCALGKVERAQLTYGVVSDTPLTPRNARANPQISAPVGVTVAVCAQALDGAWWLHLAYHRLRCLLSCFSRPRTTHTSAESGPLHLDLPLPLSDARCFQDS